MKQTASKPQRPSAEASLKFVLIALAVISLLVLLVYSRTFSGEFQFDDARELQESYAIRQFPNLKAIWDFAPTRFLTYFSFGLNYYFNELDVMGYHLVNTGLHILASLFSFLLARLILTRYGSRSPDLPALTAALFFAVHPLQTGAVSYIIQRAAVMAALFYLAALFFYGAWRAQGGRLRFASALACTAAAMFTKQNAFTLPFAIILLEFFFFSENLENFKKRAVSLMPFLAALLIVPVIHLSVYSGETLVRDSQMISRSVYLLTQLNVLRTYLRLTFFPAGQNVDYDYPLSSSLADPATFASLLLLAGLFAAAVVLFRKNKIFSFSVFWFFLTLSVESGLVPIRDVIFEHRMYLPLFGPALAAACFCYRRSEKTGLIISAVLVLALAVAAFQRNEVWRDGVRLWQDAVAKSPRKARPLHNLSYLYSARGDYRKSIELGEKAVALNPESSGPYFTLGVAYGRMGNVDKELEYYQKAFERGAWNPAKHYNNMGAAYGRKGELEKAVENFKKAMEADPGYPPTYANYGFAMDKAGNFAEAVALYKKAVELDPSFAEAYNYMAISYAKSGDLHHGLHYAGRAVKINPKYADAYNTLGLVYGMKNDLDRMIEYCEKAVKADPGYKLGYRNLAAAYAKKGDREKAAFYAAKAG